jgi:hypothetical protein
MAPMALGLELAASATAPHLWLFQAQCYIKIGQVGCQRVKPADVGALGSLMMG